MTNSSLDSSDLRVDVRSHKISGLSNAHFTKSTEYTRYLVFFIAAQILVWTLIPWLFQHNLPFDTVESIAWGQQWQWGYDKHPPFTAWVCGAVTALFGAGLPTYLLAQVFIALGFLALWNLLRTIMPTANAAVSLFVLTTIWFYTLATPKLNPNTLQIGLWMITAWACHRAYFNNTWNAWILSGVLAACCMLTKFTSLLLLTPLLGLLLLTAHGRQHLKNPRCWMALFLFFMLWLPNIYWNINHDFAEMFYGMQRLSEYNTQQPSNWVRHALWPVRSLFQQILAILPALLLLAPAKFFKKSNFTVEKSQKQFIQALALGPVFLAILITVFAGIELYTSWGVPFFSLLPGLIMLQWRPAISMQQVKYYLQIGIAVSLLCGISRAGYLFFSPFITGLANADAYFPGPEIAKYVATIWQQKTSQPFLHIAGSHYLAANIAVYAAQKPAPYFDWSSAQSTWTNDAILQKEGAMFAWIEQPQRLPSAIQQRFPQAKFLGAFHFAKATAAKVDPVIIGIAYLPPKVH